MSEEQMNDSTFGRLFIIMIIAMTVLTIVIAVLASFASSEVNAKLDERSELENTQAIADRIAPVGKFSATTTSAEPVVAAVLTSEEMYQASCSFCHAVAGTGAPVTGDNAAWADRIGKGLDALANSAINGIGAMPARGGSSLSDENIKAIVEYMINESK